jgi:hypothetical protein
MSPVLDLADLIVGSLDAAQFSIPFTAERVYQLPADAENADLAHYDTLRVYIVPGGITSTLSTRDSTEDECVVTVGILKRVPDQAELDTLVSFAGELADWFRFRHFDIGGLRAQWSAVEVNPIFAPRALTERRQFASVIAVTYRVHRGV